MSDGEGVSEAVAVAVWLGVADGLAVAEAVAVLVRGAGGFVAGMVGRAVRVAVGLGVALQVGLGVEPAVVGEAAAMAVGAGVAPQPARVANSSKQQVAIVHAAINRVFPGVDDFSEVMGFICLHKSG